MGFKDLISNRMKLKYCDCNWYECETGICRMLSKWRRDGKPCKCGYSGKKCRLSNIFMYIDPTVKEKRMPSLTRRLRKNLIKEIAKRWCERRKGSGGRYEIGGSLQDALLKMFEEKFGRNYVSKPKVNKRHASQTWCNFLPDIKIKKDNYNIFVECKVTISPESFRDAFTRAYFFKRGKRDKSKKKFYLIGIVFYKYKPAEKDESEKIINMMKNDASEYIDGIYFIGHEPFIDKLFNELLTFNS